MAQSLFLYSSANVHQIHQHQHSAEGKGGPNISLGGILIFQNCVPTFQMPFVIVLATIYNSTTLKLLLLHIGRLIRKDLFVSILFYLQKYSELKIKYMRQFIDPTEYAEILPNLIQHY